MADAWRLIAVILAFGVAVFVVYRLVWIFVMFWVRFAQGINEANPKPPGFEVQPIAKEPKRPLPVQSVALAKKERE